MRSSSMDIAGLYAKFGKNLPRFFMTFLDNRRVFLTNATPRRGPLAVVYNLSAKCDAKCPFCGYWRAGQEHGTELSFSEKSELIRGLAKAGVWLLSFCGAEPLLVEEIDALMHLAKSSGMLVNISTNGSRLFEKTSSILRSGVDSVTVSVDSHTRAVHDRLRNSPGLFEALSIGIDGLKCSRKGKSPWLAARCLVSRENWFSLREYVEHWSGRVDEIVFKPVCSSSDGMFLIPPEMAPDPERKAEFIAYFADILRDHPKLDTPYHRHLAEYLFGNCPGAQTYCFAGTFFADIDREGYLHPCTEYGSKLGNVIREGFLGVWSSPEARKFRSNIRKLKKCSSCWGDKFSSGIMVERVLKLTGGI
ncbi:MAG: radical SAM protein [Candidatus Omnitrophica bacterium]|nr:radical SAM protein [Candidatus Omnitrophota bacterium]